MASPVAPAPETPARPPGETAVRVRKLATYYGTRSQQTPADAQAPLVAELTAELTGLAAELDRYQTTAVNLASGQLAVCAPPDVANGESDCHPGEPWPCDRTRAAWALRGISAHDQVAAARAEWRRRMIELDTADDREV